MKDTDLAKRESATRKRRRGDPEQRREEHAGVFRDEDGGDGVSLITEDNDADEYELSEDVYSLFFISPWWSRGFFLALATFGLKGALYALIAVEFFQEEESYRDGYAVKVRATQFALLPVAVAIQEDLIKAYTLFGNVRYDVKVKQQHPGATYVKWRLQVALRLADGLYSLLINFAVLLRTKEVLALFLNFAALGFLQSLDDIAFSLAIAGYMTADVEDLAKHVHETSLPKRMNASLAVSFLDTVLFVLTYGALCGVYLVVTAL